MREATGFGGTPFGVFYEKKKKKRTVVLPATWVGKRLSCRFRLRQPPAQGVGQRGPGWRPTTEAIRPLRRTSPGWVQLGAPNRVTVVINNELTWESIPPGYVRRYARRASASVTSTISSTTRPPPVRVAYTTPRARVDDITVVTGVGRPAGHRALLRGGRCGDGLKGAGGVAGRGGNPVAAAVGSSGELSVDNVRLWRPGDGYLYELTVELWGMAPLRWTLTRCRSVSAPSKWPVTAS